MPSAEMNAHSAPGSSWIDDAPMPPPIASPDRFGSPGYSGHHEEFGSPQYPSSSYDSNYSQSYNVKQEPRSPMSIMSPHSMMSPSSCTSPATSHSQHGAVSPPIYLSLGHHMANPMGPSYSSAVSPNYHQVQMKQEGQDTYSYWSKSEDKTNLLRQKKEESDEEEMDSGNVKETETVHVIPEGIEVFPPEYVFHEDETWIQVKFFELAERKPRAIFTTNRPCFAIDGLTKVDNFTDSQDRFSLGTYSAQTPHANYFKQIGKGCEILKDENGNIILTNIGKASLFVQCPNFAKRQGDDLATVYRLCSPNVEPNLSTRQMMIFNKEHFDDMLSYAETKHELSQIPMYCYARISFLKGFGQNYALRRRIYDCPIWTQVKFTQPFAEIEKKSQRLYPFVQI